jgi:threonine dehydrogenase-like Zn-dependent dehydrogenase
MMGCYSYYVNAPGNHLRHLPADLPLRLSTLVKPLALCLCALDNHSTQPKESACVLGAGPLGNLCAQVLLRQGLKVTVIDSNDRRLKLLHKYDANTLRQESSLKRFDYIIETRGSQETLAFLVEASGPRAKILLLNSTNFDEAGNGGISGNDFDRELYRVDLGTDYTDYWERAIRLIRDGSVNLQDHIDVVYFLEDYEKAWEVHQGQQHLKVLLNVSKELAEL